MVWVECGWTVWCGVGTPCVWCGVGGVRTCVCVCGNKYM